ncbi:hypothetical protein LA5095_01570 [Roseibium album]|uniref:Uncharacterized protein n=1 Tax=Roseibium album TaxID=311410 RepID=A0A0M7A1S2_9HYPH|nr:hypothetical protein [Labrenzia sp. EL_13]CTQ69038.1 hypothetical protein LA5095_01570 [Roseibium album]CTQ71207.1 hypothetical protein LA5096_02824 [Roseibium album]
MDFRRPTGRLSVHYPPLENRTGLEIRFPMGGSLVVMNTGW